MKNWDVIAIVGLFYLGWFGSVFLAKTETPAFSLVFPVLLVGLLSLRKNLSRSDLGLALGISAVGIFFDWALIQLSFISITTGSPIRVPYWLISIWLLFSFSTVKLARKLNLSMGLEALL